jgi:hypothetical protein
MAYNPNDCVELRWGAPAKSDEAATCMADVMAITKWSISRLESGMAGCCAYAASGQALSAKDGGNFAALGGAVAWPLPTRAPKSAMPTGPPPSALDDHQRPS